MPPAPRGRPIVTIPPPPTTDVRRDSGEAPPARGAALVRVASGAWVRVRVRLPRLAVAALLTVLAFPVGAPGVAPGIDSSWGAALHQATREGLVFGRDVLFTYGPLGFLVDARMYFGDTWALAVFAHLTAGLLLAASLLRLLERGIGLLGSALVAAPLVMLLSRLLLVGSPLLPEVLVLVVMLWSFEVVLAGGRPVPTSRVLLAAAATAAVTTMKLDAGIACLVLAGYAITVAGFRRAGARAAAVELVRFLVAAAGALMALWLTVGQPIGALPDWLRRSVAIVRGYGAAMNIESGQHWEYTVALLLIGAVAVLIIRSSYAEGADRWTTLVLFAVVAFIAFKQGFVRHDAHVVQFFAVFAVLPAVFIRKWGTAPTLLTMIVPFAALCAVGNVGVTSLLDPGPRLQSMRDVVHLARSPDARRELVDATRTGLRAEYRIPRTMVDRMRGRSASVEPWELLVAYAYPEIRWRELPVFQTYNAYTTSLDRLNSDARTGPERPRFVLREVGQAIDGRVPRFESPATALGTLCHYRTVKSDGRWQLLQATADRCGTPTLIARRDAHFGETVTVPPASDRSIVVARFHRVADGPVDELRTLAFRARVITIRIDDGSPRRFVQGHQDAPHVLTAPTCARDDLDGVSAQLFRHFSLGADSALGGDDYEVEFYRLAFAC